MQEERNTVAHQLVMDMTILSKLIDLITFVVGTVLLLLGVFGFSHERVSVSFGGGGYAIVYFYDDAALLLIAVGGGLVVLGFLLRSWRHGSK